jgi:hypothetical protein
MCCRVIDEWNGDQVNEAFARRNAMRSKNERQDRFKYEDCFPSFVRSTERFRLCFLTPGRVISLIIYHLPKDGTSSWVLYDILMEILLVFYLRGCGLV